MGRPSPLPLDEIGPVFDTLLRGPLALAVSGGADSMALMHLVVAWCADRRDVGVPPIVLTVDHGLRPEAADEAAWVGRQAARLGFTPVTLAWTGPKPASGLQAAARAARYRLMSDFLEREFRDGVVACKRCIVTAHHADDQAETFLMRLARGSGLDGLSGMRPRETIQPGCLVGVSDTGCTILRPLLHVPKARLIATLEALGLEWREDPGNASHDFERVRVREALRLLDGVGIGAVPIERSARRLARARAAVAAGVAGAAQRLVRLNGGLFAEIDRDLLSRVPDEFQICIFAALLEAFGGASPPARLLQIEALVAQMSAAAHHDRRRATTLGGCRIARDIDGTVLIWREAGRDGGPQLDLQPGAAVLWDQRFAVTLAAEEAAAVRVRALGEDGVRQLGAGLLVSGDPARRKAPHGALETLPSLWREGRLVAVPYLQWPQATAPGCSAEFVAAKLFSGDPPRVLTQG